MNRRKYNQEETQQEPDFGVGLVGFGHNPPNVLPEEPPKPDEQHRHKYNYL